MEKYEKARMEVIEFDAEDVITTSCPEDLGFCSAGAPACTVECDWDMW